MIGEMSDGERWVRQSNVNFLLPTKLPASAKEKSRLFPSKLGFGCFLPTKPTSKKFKY